MPRFASIDMGTNTFRLLIAEIGDDLSLKTLYSQNRIVRIGEGFSQGKFIRPEALERALAALHVFRKVIAEESLSGLIVTGTSALRDAENREVFLSAIKEQCGFKVEVLSGQEEARLTLMGVNMIFSEAEQKNESSLVIDIGGGSTEVIQAKRGQSPVCLSLNLGAVPLSESHLQSDPPALNDIRRLKNTIAGTLSKVAHHFTKHCRFVGTAGTVTSLAAIDQKMTQYDPNKINRYQISRARIAEILEHFIALPKEKRRNISGLEKGREDIIIAGTMILLEAMDCFVCDMLHVSDYGLREGVLVDRFRNYAKETSDDAGFFK